MFGLKFDVKKFLAMPMNDGDLYLSECGTYGCLKGDFVLCSNIIKSFNTMSVEDRHKVCMATLANHSFEIFGHHSWAATDEHLSKEDPKLQCILDRAEQILVCKKDKVRAKWFLVRALRKYGYVPQETVLTKDLVRV